MSTLSLNTATMAGTQSASAAATATTQGQVASGVGTVVKGLSKVHERLSAQLQTASTSISQLGQYKATLSALSGVAGALAGVGSGAASADVVKKAEAFVSAFNAAVLQAKGSGDGAGQTEASQALAESRRALTSTDASRSQLNKLGFARQADGTLKLDAAALKKALGADAAGATGTLAQLGKATAKRAEAELAGDGRISLAVKKASDRSHVLKQQQSALANVAAQTLQPQTTGGSWVAKQALKTYASV